MELGLGLTKIIPPLLYLGAIWVVILTLLWRIEIGIFFLVPLLPLQNILDAISTYPLGKDLVDVLYLALLVRWWFDWQKRKAEHKEDKSQWQTPMDKIVLLIVVWTFMTLCLGVLNLGDTPLFSSSNDRFITWKNYVMLPLLYLIIVNNIKDEKNIRILLLLMAFAMLFMGRNFYHNFSGRDTSHYSHELRGSGTFTYLGPNELAVFYAQNTIVIACLFLLDRQFWRKMLFLGATLFNIYAIAFLFSRGGYLATMAGLVFLGFVRERKILVVVALFLVFWRSVTPIAIQERIDMTKTEKGTDHSIEDRYLMWEQAAAIFLSNPITGMGFRSVPSLGIEASMQRNSLHNGYLEVAVEQGGIGILIYLIFYSRCIRYGWRLYKTAEDRFFKGLGLGYVGSVVAILAGNIAGSYWFYMNVSGFFWALTALVIRTLVIVGDKQPELQDQDEDPQKEDIRYRPPLPHQRPAYPVALEKS